MRCAEIVARVFRCLCVFSFPFVCQGPVPCRSRVKRFAEKGGPFFLVLFCVCLFWVGLAGPVGLVCLGLRGCFVLVVFCFNNTRETYGTFWGTSDF